MKVLLSEGTIPSVSRAISNLYMVTAQPAELFPAKSPQAECCLLLHVDRTWSDRNMTLPARFSTNNSEAFDLGELKKKL